MSPISIVPLYMGESYLHAGDDSMEHEKCGNYTYN